MYKTHNEKEINVDRTSYVGEITTTYQTLVDTFGEPTKSDEYKVDAEWIIESPDGVVATIYNWKNGKNYLGNEGLDTVNIINWNVGGFDGEAIKLVTNILE